MSNVTPIAETFVRDDLAKSVTLGGQRIHLTNREYQVLGLLIERKGETVTRDTILDHLYGGEDEPQMKIIDVFICKLRKKLAVAPGAEKCIVTVRGSGYKIDDSG